MRACAAKLLLISAVTAGVPVHADVAITGVEGALLDNVLAFLDLDTEPCDAERSLVERKHRGAPDAIRTALQALGYYDPQITPSLEHGADCWHATFAIAAGEPVRLRTIDLRVTGDGSADTAFATAQSAAPLRGGEALDHGAYERLKRTLGDLAAERGYAEARFEEHRIDVYPREHVADVTLRFDTGPRYRFGAVSFRQQVLSEQLLGSFKQFSAGDWYDGRALSDLQSALTNSGYFRVVQVAPQPPDRERREIPVEIVLTPAPRKLITYGLGFATDTGLALRFDRNNRRWNGRGHQFGFYAHLSPVLSEVMANYRMPLDEPREEWINFDAGIKSEDTETASSDTFVLGARRLSRGRGGWFRTDSLSLQLEDFELAEQRGRSRLLMPAVSWSRIRADNRIRVERGSKLQLEVRGAGDDLGSETTFLQTIATAEWIRPLTARGRMLLRGQVGATAFEELEELPASVRFFAGGDNSVRGYGFKELGPVDDEGEVIGGSSLFAASFEYEHSLRERWGIAFFVDSGNAFDGSALTLKTGIGLGGRWQSPIGPVRLDLAHPLDDPANDWRVHVTFGPDL